MSAARGQALLRGRSLAGRLGLGAGVPVLAAAHAAHRAAQELRLLVHLLEALAAARLLARGLGDLLRRTFLRLGSCLATRLPRLGLPLALREALPLATLPALAEAGAVLVAAERPVGPLLVLMALILVTLLSGLVLATALRTRLRLVARRHLRHERRLEAVVGHVALVAELVEAFAHLARPAHALAEAVAPVAGLIELLAVGHDDAAVVLGVLEIVLRQHRVAARLCLARQREVLLRNVSGSAADPLRRPVRFEAARQRIAVVPLAVVVVVVAATSAAVLLSLPH